VNDDPIRLEAIRRIVTSIDGVIRVDDQFDPIRLVIDPESGFPAAPLSSSQLSASSFTLYLPEDHPHAVQLAVEPRAVDPANHGASDRWMAYFNRPRSSGFAILQIESYKRLDVVFDGPDVRFDHPFRSQESALCRQCNANPDAVLRACALKLHAMPDAAMVVGVDPFGLDVRVRFGVIRLDFPGVVMESADAQVAIRELLE